MPTEEAPVRGGEFLPPWPHSDAPAATATTTAAGSPGPAPAQTQTVVPANYGVTYCTGCGNPINPQAAVCMNCGVATARFALAPPNPKQKSTAVVLVVLFGLFGWLYTYKRDAWKFWLNLAMAVVTLGFWGLVAWVWAIIDMAIRPSAFYEGFPNG